MVVPSKSPYAPCLDGKGRPLPDPVLGENIRTHQTHTIEGHFLSAFSKLAFGYFIWVIGSRLLFRGLAPLGYKNVLPGCLCTLDVAIGGCLPTEPHADKLFTQLSPALVSKAPPLESPRSDDSSRGTKAAIRP